MAYFCKRLSLENTVILQTHSAFFLASFCGVLRIPFSCCVLSSFPLKISYNAEKNRAGCALHSVVLIIGTVWKSYS